MELHCSPTSPQKPVTQLQPLKTAELYPWQIEARGATTGACAVMLLFSLLLPMLPYALEEDVDRLQQLQLIGTPHDG